MKVHCDALLTRQAVVVDKFEKKYSYIANEKMSKVTGFVDGLALEQAKMGDKVNQLDYFYKDLSVASRKNQLSQESSMAKP